MPDVQPVSGNTAPASPDSASDQETSSLTISLGATMRVGLDHSGYSGKSGFLQVEYDKGLSSLFSLGLLGRAGFRQGVWQDKTPEGAPLTSPDKGFEASAGFVAGIKPHPAVSLKFGIERVFRSEAETKDWRGSAGLDFDLGGSRLGVGVGYLTGGLPAEGGEVFFTYGWSFGQGSGKSNKAKTTEAPAVAAENESPVPSKPVTPLKPAASPASTPDFAEAPTILFPKNKTSFRAGSQEEVAVTFVSTTDAIAYVSLDGEPLWKGLVSKEKATKMVVVPSLSKKFPPTTHQVEVLLFANVGDAEPAARASVSFEVKKTRPASQTQSPRTIAPPQP